MSSFYISYLWNKTALIITIHSLISPSAGGPPEIKYLQTPESTKLISALKSIKVMVYLLVEVFSSYFGNLALTAANYNSLTTYKLILGFRK